MNREISVFLEYFSPITLIKATRSNNPTNEQIKNLIKTIEEGNFTGYNPSNFTKKLFGTEKLIINKIVDTDYIKKIEEISEDKLDFNANTNSEHWRLLWKIIKKKEGVCGDGYWRD